MHKLVTVLRRVILYNPVDFWDVNTSSWQVCGQEQLVIFKLDIIEVFELSIDFATLLLVDFAMQFADGSVRE